MPLSGFNHSCVFEPTRAGTCSFIARFADHDDHLDDTSHSRRFKVLR
jgi:hypothetical protein